MKTFQEHLTRVKRPLRHVKKVRHVKWLLPGWVFYEYYKLNKSKGETTRKSFGQGAKAEGIRLVAFASVPIPGTYELTTTGLALLKNKIEKGEMKNLTLKAFRDFTPIKRLKINKEELIGKNPYLKIAPKGKRLYFKIFYRRK